MKYLLIFDLFFAEWTFNMLVWLFALVAYYKVPAIKKYDVSTACITNYAQFILRQKLRTRSELRTGQDLQRFSFQKLFSFILHLPKTLF